LRTVAFPRDLEIGMVRGSAGLSQPGVGAFSTAHRAATFNAGNPGWPAGRGARRLQEPCFASAS